MLQPVDTLLRSHGAIYSQQQSRELLAMLMRDIHWQHEYFAFGRRVSVPRLQAWYADAGVHYRYSDNLLRSHDWIESLLAIRRQVEDLTGQGFNSVLATCYRNGDDYVGWHADDEAELGENPVIASLSFGASRDFCYRHKHTREQACLRLHDGELLLMQPPFQTDWEHCVPMLPSVTGARINLTFRQVVMLRDQ